MDRQNPESHLGDEAVVEPSSEQEKSQRSLQKHDVEHKVLLRNNITEGDQEEEEEGRDWSEISEDILELIAARMHIGDRIQSSRVCKHWRSMVVRAAPKSHPASYGSPCLLKILIGKKRCTLTDPFRNERYVIDTPSIPHGVLIEHSNNGWLLMVKCRISDVPVLFFNPLTQDTMELPKLETTKYSTFSFSSEPTSSDCRVIGTQHDGYSTSFCYWVPGAKEWKIFTIINHQETIFQASSHNPFLLEDRIYHLDNGGRLEIYDLSDQKLTVIAIEPPIKAMIFYSLYCHFVKMDDKIVLVYKEDKAGSRRIHLYEFDESEKQLIKLETIRGRSLFYCDANCILDEATSRAGGERVYAWDDVDNEIMMSCPSVTNELQTLRIFKDDPEKRLSSFFIDVCWIDLKS